MDILINFIGSPVLIVLLGLFIIGLAGFAIYYFVPAPDTQSMNSSNAATALSRIILIGLVVTVGLMTGLAIVFNFLGLSVKEQPLGLPEGSIRSIIAFSMVLIFVCLAAFLYGGVSAGETNEVAKLTRVAPADLNTYKQYFIAVHQPAKKPDGALDIDPTSGQILSYDVNLFAKRNKDSDDFAKQIFTTLGTVFVSVISFYFGSSVTASGIKTGETITQQRTVDTAGGNITPSVAQQRQIAQSLGKAPGNPVEVDVSPKVGNLLPASAAPLQSCPADVATVSAGFANCRYILVKDQFVLVEANSQRIIAVINK
jgi:hypothetical protein